MGRLSYKDILGPVSSMVFIGFNTYNNRELVNRFYTAQPHKSALNYLIDFSSDILSREGSSPSV